MNDTKQQIIDAIAAFIWQRPGFEPGNYADWPALRSDMRRAQQQLRDARTLLQAVTWRDGITAAAMLAPQSDRFKVAQRPDGSVQTGYCTGQYWCTEYRAGVCRYLAYLLWEYVRESYPHYDGDALRAHFRREFGRGLASRYFN